jgi:hypothetical protein
VLGNGQIPAAARDGFERVFASWRSGKTERIHGRLIRLITRVSDHFGGRPIHVISGFRPQGEKQQALRSKHNLGRAVDFRIPGVPNEAIRDFCRRLSNVGIGYYPNSTFVHLDMRERPAYWIDYSEPGERARYATASGADPADSPSRKPARSKSRSSRVSGHKVKGSARSEGTRIASRSVRRSRQTH